MARGPKKHLKRLNAPHHWMLDKLSGTFVSMPSKIRFCVDGVYANPFGL